MYLKIMHDGADEFLDQAQSDATHSIIANVTECHFRRYKASEATNDGGKVFGEALISRQSAAGQEIETHVQLTGDAFLMNEQGRTISKFRAYGYAGQSQRDGKPNTTDEEQAIKLLQAMPSAVVKAIRQSAVHAGSVSADFLIKILDKARVAEDAG